MRLQRQSVLPCTFDRAISEVMTVRLLVHIARPLVAFEPVDESCAPERWQEETYWYRLKLFGFLPFGKQAIRISVHPDSDTQFRLRDNGYSRLIRRWDHWITIRQVDDQVLYEDALDLDAGWLTPFIWIFACVFYAHRQRRWVALAESGFNYID